MDKKTIYPDKASGKFTYILVAKDVSAIKKNGLTVKGEGIKITQLVCEPAPIPKKKTKPIKAEVPKIKFEAYPAPLFPENSPAAKHGKLKVDGAYLYDQTNEKFMLYEMIGIQTVYVWHFMFRKMVVIVQVEIRIS